MSGRCNLEWDSKEYVNSAVFSPPIAPSGYDEADDSLLCNFQSSFGDPGRDALMLGHLPNASSEFRGLSGTLPVTDEALLASLQPLNKKARCVENSLTNELHSNESSAASGWKLVQENHENQYTLFQNSVISRKQQNQLQSYTLPATLPYGDPPQSFLTTISSLDPVTTDHSELPVHHMPYMNYQLQAYEVFEQSFSSPSESETLTTEKIPKIEPTESAQPKPSRRSSRAVVNSRRSLNRSKGVTMCLRTLLRQLLAGTGWIMDSSISKDQATRLIRTLIGKDLDKKLNIELSPERAERMTSEHKERHFARILPDLMTFYIGKAVTLEESQEYIKRDKGPYHLTPEFLELLQNKPWPPVLESDTDLRDYGCYRQGEASKRARTSSSDSVANNIS
eukprot:g4471.t1